MQEARDLMLPTSAKKAPRSVLGGFLIRYDGSYFSSSCSTVCIENTRLPAS